MPGMNSRLDEMQAAILRAKLPHLDAWNETRRGLAAIYAAQLPPAVVQPVELPGCRHVYHLYVVRVAERDGVRARLQAAGVGTGIHYPVPIHRQPAYAHLPQAQTRLPHTERLAGEIVSLPMHPWLTGEQAQTVAAALVATLGAPAA
jgi:dTDP-4-amino-4,6-dideoxygalactose transaminase